MVEKLAPEGLRVVLTSRPEGVRLGMYKKEFVIMNLEKLSDEQQKELIARQIGDNPFFEHLSETVALRRKHDEIYQQEAFPDAEMRRALETMEPLNKFKLPNGQRDPAMRQRTSDGKGFVRRSRGSVKSRYLKDLCGFFTRAVLTVLNEVVADKPVTVKEAVGLALRTKLPDAEYPEDRHSVTERLVGLAVKMQKTASALWPDIVERTDLLYLTFEDLLPDFKDAMNQFIMDALGDGGREDVELILAPTLKDPVRVHEKAIDDYIHDFNDWDEDVVLPEACVLDMLRGRAVCSAGATLFKLQQRLMEGVTLKVNGRDATLTSIRNKIKVAGNDLDPMHFRNILNNLELSIAGRSGFVELQVHHASIYKWNEECHSHYHFEFFRTKLANQYQQGLNQVPFHGHYHACLLHPPAMHLTATVTDPGADPESTPACSGA